jgi:hypothetical protein
MNAQARSIFLHVEALITAGREEAAIRELERRRISLADFHRAVVLGRKARGIFDNPINHPSV